MHLAYKGTWAVTVSSNHCVYLLTTAQDQLIGKFGGCGRKDSQFNHPDGSDDDHLFVVDRDSHRVQKFDINGMYLLQFGTKGIRNSQLDNPHGIMAYNENVYIADCGNSHISVFQVSSQISSIASLVWDSLTGLIILQ